jgi:hypothetical protein
MNTFKITPGIQTGLKAVGRQVRVGTVFRPEGTVAPGSRDRSNIGGVAFFLATLLSFVVYTLLLAHEISARQG